MYKKNKAQHISGNLAFCFETTETDGSPRLVQHPQPGVDFAHRSVFAPLQNMRQVQ